MENNTDDAAGTNAFRGLLDSDRVAAYLGVPRGTLRSWESRKADGKPGIHSLFPEPLPERLGGASLWEESDIIAFKKAGEQKRSVAEKKRDLKSASSKNATEQVQPVESKHE